jgi:glucokinase
MSKTEVTLGIDIGGTNTKIGFVDRAGNCLIATSMPTVAPVEVGPAEELSLFLERLYQTIDRIYASIADTTELKGIGMGVPNGNYYKGTVEKPTNLNWEQYVPLARILQEKYGIPAVLTNDAKAAAMGELKYGVAKGMKNFLVVTLGTGLGSGFYVNGDIMYGADGFAGELGHVTVKVNGRMCGCGKKGCLETYVSATGIRRTVYKLLADHTEDSPLRKVSFDDLTGEMITEAALKGDKIAIEAFEYTGRILGLKLADVVAIAMPEAIILFGGLTRAGDYLFEPTRKYMEQYIMGLYKGKVKILGSGLVGANTAVLGASALIWNQLDKKQLQSV